MNVLLCLSKSRTQRTLTIAFPVLEACLGMPGVPFRARGRGRATGELRYTINPQPDITSTAATTIYLCYVLASFCCRCGVLY